MPSDRLLAVHAEHGVEMVDDVEKRHVRSVKERRGRATLSRLKSPFFFYRLGAFDFGIVPRAGTGVSG